MLWYSVLAWLQRPHLKRTSKESMGNTWTRHVVTPTVKLQLETCYRHGTERRTRTFGGKRGGAGRLAAGSLDAPLLSATKKGLPNLGRPLTVRYVSIWRPRPPRSNAQAADRSRGHSGHIPGRNEGKLHHQPIIPQVDSQPSSSPLRPPRPLRLNHPRAVGALPRRLIYLPSPWPLSLD